MARFIQLHFLTCYAPSNLNRDDLGKPKTTLFGGTQRLRVSSQSLKRAWRTSRVFVDSLGEAHLGKRTRDLGTYVKQRLIELKKKELGGDDKDVGKAFESLAEKQGERFEGLFSVPRSRKEKTGGDADGEDGESGKLGQIAFISASELQNINELIKRIIEGKPVDDDKIKRIVSQPGTSVDVALFGRMLTDMNANSEKAKKLPDHQRDIAKVERSRFAAAVEVERER